MTKIALKFINQKMKVKYRNNNVFKISRSNSKKYFRIRNSGIVMHRLKNST